MFTHNACIDEAQEDESAEEAVVEGECGESGCLDASLEE